MDGKIVGQASITVDGLYAQIRCHCYLPEGKIYAVFTSDNDGENLLGTCLPAERCWLLTTKVPKKRIMKDNVRLFVAEKYADTSFEDIPLILGEPINAIEELDRCAFRLKNGAAYFLIQEKDSRLCAENSKNS